MANLGSDSISVIDPATNGVVHTLRYCCGPKWVAITPNGHSAYIGNPVVGTVSVVDMATNAVVDTVKVGRQPEGVDVTPDGSRVYVANRASHTVSVIVCPLNHL